MRRAASFQLHPGKTNRNPPMAYLTEAKIRERTHEPLSATHGIPGPVFGHRRLPTGKRRLLVGEATQARPFLRHLAAVQAKLAFRLAPAMRRSVVLRLLPRGRAARHSGVVFPHRGPCRDQTGAIPEARRKLIATRRPIRKRFDLCARGTRGGTDRISLFMALLSVRGISHPAPTSSTRAPPLPPRAAGDLTA
jgi:hypothetical protein